MLVGKVPFAVDSKNNQSSEYIRIELMKKIMDMKPPKIKSHRPDCPSSLEKVVLKMLEKDPEKRYGSFKEIKSNIKNTSNIESVRLLQTTKNARHNHRAKKGNYLAALWLSILLTFVIILLLEIIKI
jgi:serine/threonine protein kinase